MSNRFIDKLRALADLADDDIALLETATVRRRTVSAGRDLISEGDEPGPIFVILKGWACRYKMVPEGRRQIVAFLMPGDSCALHVQVLDRMDHGIQTLTQATVASIDRRDMERILETRPRIARALWSAQLIDEGTMREWIVSMGRRNGAARVAHLMCELYLRRATSASSQAARWSCP